MVKLLLYDPKGNLKSGLEYESEHEAWGSGENWKMLTHGNTYLIENSMFKAREFDLNLNKGDEKK